MKIVQVTAYDLIGQQFGGYQLHRALCDSGNESHLVVKHRFSDDRGVHDLGSRYSRWIDEHMLIPFERLVCLRSCLTLSSLTLRRQGYFKQSELLHLHLVHTEPFFNLSVIRKLSHSRPVVWSLHDPWMQTGHCVYPMNCLRWRSGCGRCQSLSAPFAQNRDTTALQWRLKRLLVRNSRLTFVVASTWMRNLVEESPILRSKECHIIPYGLDTDVYRPYSDAVSCRAHFGIPEGNKVIAFRYRGRADTIKGGDVIERALLRLRNRKLSLLLFEGHPDIDRLKGSFHVVTLGWVRDERDAAMAYSVADVFLMPSRAEAFGMMAVEAMACGTPVVGTTGTALSEVIPKGAGLLVAPGDDEALAGAICLILDRRNAKQEMGEVGRRTTLSEHRVETYLSRHLELYASEIARFQAESNRPHHSES